jgi:hypothetical protein
MFYFSLYAAAKGSVRPKDRYPTVAAADGALNSANNNVEDRNASILR